MVNAATASIRALWARRSGMMGGLAGMIGGFARRLSSREAEQCPGMTLPGKLVATRAMPPRLPRCARDGRGFARDGRGVGFTIATFLLLALLAARGAAAADSGPFLVLETGVHEAAIKLLNS